MLEGLTENVRCQLNRFVICFQRDTDIFLVTLNLRKMFIEI